MSSFLAFRSLGSTWVLDSEKSAKLSSMHVGEGMLLVERILESSEAFEEMTEARESSVAIFDPVVWFDVFTIYKVNTIRSRKKGTYGRQNRTVLATNKICVYILPIFLPPFCGVVLRTCWSVTRWRGEKRSFDDKSEYAEKHTGKVLKVAESHMHWHIQGACLLEAPGNCSICTQRWQAEPCWRIEK